MKQNIKKLVKSSEVKNPATTQTIENLSKKGRKAVGSCPEL